MSAHTPGPWAVAESPGYLAVVDSEGPGVCEVRARLDGSEAAANARLIAAAPDLLVALKAAELHMLDAESADNADYRAVVAAIAKAEGREP